MDTVNVDNHHVRSSSTDTTANGGMTDEAEGIWSPDIEQSFLEALAIYPPCGRRKIILTEEGKMYGRNELVARYIKIRTGKTRTRKQVSSHLQVLAKRHAKEIQSLRDDKVAKQIILDRLKQYTSAEIVSMNSQKMQTDNDSFSDDNDESKQSTNSPIKNLLQPSVPIMTDDFCLSPQKSVVIKKPMKTNFKSNSSVVFANKKHRSRCSSNASSSSPLSSGSTASQSLMIPNLSAPSFAIIGDENFRLHDLSAFAEIKRTIGTPTHPSLIYPTTEAYAIDQHDLLRLHANDIQMRNLHTFETISIDQIFDKFPRYEGLKDLFELNPDGSFFLIKFWADVSLGSSLMNTMNMRDESFFTSYTYASCLNRPIHISTRLCSFGKQVLEKVDTSEHPQRDQFDQYIYRFDRSSLCDYMVQFIQKLRSLPNAYMMNSVLENFTILQVIKCLDNPERLLLCLAFVFEIPLFDAGGPQYHVYKLVAN